MRVLCHPARLLVLLSEYRSTSTLWIADRVHIFAFQYLLMLIISDIGVVFAFQGFGEAHGEVLSVREYHTTEPSHIHSYL